MANNLGITLPLQRGASGYFRGTSDTMAQIKSNVTNLLLTNLGERLMQPEFGSELLSYVFQHETTEGLSGIQASVEKAAGRWMPFLKIGEVTVAQSPETHQIVVNVPYTLVTNNITDSITLVF